ncbi:hypothetical protein LTR07_006771 [Exophiala xenobiotica]|nr:hypothetical protein LTR07_006771 [Exophiala xenobiotica]
MTLVGGSVIVFPKLDPAKDASQKVCAPELSSEVSTASDINEDILKRNLLAVEYVVDDTVEGTRLSCLQLLIINLNAFQGSSGPT